MARGFGPTFGSGTTDHIATPLTSHAVTRTYSMWSYRRTLGGTGLGRIFDKRSSGAQVELWRVDGTNPANELYLYERSWSAGLASWGFPVVNVSANVWHHLAVSYDGGSSVNAPVMYVDGVAQVLTQAVGSGGTLNTNADPYILGNRANDNARNWDGLNAEWAVWNRILSAAEIATLARGVSPRLFPDSLVEYAPLWGLDPTEPVFLVTGDGGTATVTGTARANHAPVRPFTYLQPRLFTPTASTSFFRRSLSGRAGSRGVARI